MRRPVVVGGARRLRRRHVVAIQVAIQVAILGILGICVACSTEVSDATTSGASTGDPACANPYYQCATHEMCDITPGMCGELRQYTLEGCLRPPCRDDTACPDGQRCYFATDFVVLGCSDKSAMSPGCAPAP